jgi:hypothetical protein
MLRYWAQPTGECVSWNRDIAVVKQRIVERIVHELRELLGEWLHIGLLDHVRRGTEVRAEHEGVSGGGVDSVCSPGAAERCVALGVVGGVMRRSNDELAILPRDLLEKLSLKEFDVDDGERPAVPF